MALQAGVFPCPNSVGYSKSTPSSGDCLNGFETRLSRQIALPKSNCSSCVDSWFLLCLPILSSRTGRCTRAFQSDQKDFASTGQAFKDEMGGLAPAFLAYSEKWNANSISADWSGYCADTRAVLDALENRLEREDRDLFPLLERLDRAA